MDKIKFLEVETGKDENDYLEATITYEHGSPKVIKDKVEIANTIVDFVVQEKAEYNDLIHDTSKVIFTPKVRTNPAPANPEPIPQDENESGLGPIAPKKGGKAKKVVKVGGIVVVVGLALYGGYEVFKAIFKNGFSVNTGKPSVTVEDTYNTSATQTETQNQGYYTVNRRNDPAPYNGSKYLDNLEASHAQGDLLEEIKSIKYRPMTRKEFLKNLSRLNLDIETNIDNVNNLLLGNGIHGDDFSLYLETFFEEGTIEYAAVKRFCALRNNIIISAYASSNNSLTDVYNAINRFYEVYTRFVFNQYDLSPNNGFQYKKLDPMAKYIIVELGKAILTLPVDYSFEYLDGSTWNKDTIIKESEVVFDMAVKLLNGQISLDGNQLNASDFDILTRSLFDSAKSRSRG